MEILKIPQGEFCLSRYPKRKNNQLRAWDAADEYLLNYLNDECEVKDDVLIVNDSFGAIAIALSNYSLTVWNDSYLAEKGLENNLHDNGLLADSISLMKSTESLNGQYQFVLIKIPKSLALLEDQLIRLRPFISSTTKIVASGMAKAIHTSTLKLFEKYIGETKTSLAKKKARLIFCRLDENIQNVESPYPKKYVLENTHFTIFNYANVFSRESLDIGTRFFIQHIPKSEKYKNIIDLGCGNGVVGLMAADKNPQADILFCDSSYMAVESARETLESAFSDSNSSSSKRNALFQVNDCLTGVEDNSADLILNNPPFHQDNAVGDEVAWKMFKQSKDVLKQNGELWVIGNRHLAYHVKLKKLFGNCEMVASNKKFVILKAVNV